VLDPSSLLPLEDLVPEIAGGIQAFLSKHRTPFLVLEKVEAAEKARGSTKIQDATTMRTGKSREARMVAPIAKRLGSAPYENLVTIGRAETNDIFIGAGTISKLHAYFVEEPKGCFGLVDAGSSNGTFVRGQKLPRKGAPVVLDDGDVVRLGPVFYGVFMKPETFAKLLDQLARAAT